MSNSVEALVSIKKLIVRGPLEDPSTLEVVGTAATESSVRVRFLQDELEDSGDPYFAESPRAEYASFIGGPADRIDDAYKSAPVKTPYFNVDSPDTGVVWSAKFYLWDHPELKRLWRQFCRELETDTASTSTGNAHEVDTESRRTEDFDLTAALPARIGIGVETEDGVTIPPKFFSKMELIHGFPFEVGVLFVHGIGPHKKRETLVQFGEPIFNFWRELLGKSSFSVGERLDSEERKEWCDQVLTGRLRNRQDNEGIKEAVDRFKKQVFNHSAGPLLESQQFRCGWARVKDTVVDQTSDPRFPASSLVRLSSLYSDQSLRESHVLLSEAWWTDKVIPYSFVGLRRWVTEALPIAARMHIYG